MAQEPVALTQPAHPIAAELAPMMMRMVDVAAASQVRMDTRAMTPRSVSALQRTVGNRAVQRMISPRISTATRVP